MKTTNTQFVTDTSAFAVFDPAALEHRLISPCDWWTVPWRAAEEINAGNCAIFNLEQDGHYQLSVSIRRDVPPIPHISLRTPSGELFCVAAEEITGDGREPECIRGGLIVPIPASGCAIRAERRSSSAIHLDIWLGQTDSVNAVETYLELD